MQLRLIVFTLVAIAALHSCSTTTAPPPPLRTTLEATKPPPNQCPFDCDSPGPPPELLNFLPPPPLPSFMLHVIKEHLENNKDQEQDDSHQQQDGRTCVLCDWALGPNASDVAVAPSFGDNKEAGWVAILIVASIASAIVGATLMVLVLKCKRLKILPVGDSCPILPRMSSTSTCPRRGAACSADLAHHRAAPDDKREKQVQSRTKGTRGGSSNTTACTGGAAWNFWRRTNSQERPLRSSSSVGSEENSYCEEPYVVSEHSSALYAELNSLGCSRASGSPDGHMGDGNGRHQVPCCDYRAYSMNTYSQVAEQVVPPQNFQHQHHHHHHHHQIHHHPPVSVCCSGTAGTYENAAYITTETLQGESDTPSSAYYSDSSNNHRPQDPAKTSQRHKRKRHVLASACAGAGMGTGQPTGPGPLLARFSDSGSAGSDASYAAAPPTTADVDGNCEVEEEDEDEEEEEEDEEDDYDADGGFLGDFRVSKRPLPPIPHVHTTTATATAPTPTTTSHGDRPLPPLPSQYV